MGCRFTFVSPFLFEAPQQILRHLAPTPAPSGKKTSVLYYETVHRHTGTSSVSRTLCWRDNSVLGGDAGASSTTIDGGRWSQLNRHIKRTCCTNPSCPFEKPYPAKTAYQDAPGSTIADSRGALRLQKFMNKYSCNRLYSAS